MSELKDLEEVKLHESIGDNSVTPVSMDSDSQGRETRLRSKISDLELENMLRQEEHEREIGVMETKLQEVKRNNRDLQKHVQALYEEIRRLSDSIRPQELEIDVLKKQKERLEKVNQNLLHSMKDIIHKLPNFCRVSYSEHADGTVILDLRRLD